MKAIAKVASARWGATDAAADAAGFGSFEQQADVVMSRARTQRAQLIGRAAVVVLLLLVLWACFAHVEEVTRGDRVRRGRFGGSSPMRGGVGRASGSPSER